MVPEPVIVVLDKFDEGDDKAPGVGSVRQQPLQQDPGDLLPEFVTVTLRKQVEQGTGEVVGVGVRIAELVTNRIQEEIPTW